MQLCIYADSWGMVLLYNENRMILTSAVWSQVNSVLHPFGVAKSSTSFGWGVG